jgi:hypothetical protein
VAVGAALVSGAWELAQWCNDGGLKNAGDSLSQWSQGWKNSTDSGLVGGAKRLVGSAADALGSGLSKVGGWLKGLW